jgi:hypothetical protein
VNQVNVRRLSEHQAQKMQLAAGRRCAKGGLLRMRLEPGHQILQAGVRAVLAHRQRQRKLDQLRHRNEIGVGFVVQLLEGQRGDDDRRQRRDQHRAAVRRGRFQQFRGHAPAGTRLVLDDHRHAQGPRDLVGHHPGDDVTRTTGWKADHQSDRATEALAALRVGHSQRRRADTQGQQGAANLVECHFSCLS